MIDASLGLFLALLATAPLFATFYWALRPRRGRSDRTAWLRHNRSQERGFITLNQFFMGVLILCLIGFFVRPLVIAYLLLMLVPIMGTAWLLAKFGRGK